MRTIFGIFFVALFSFCSAAQQKIVVWGKAISGADRGFEAQVREFEKRNPDLKVSALSLGAGHMDPQKLLTAIVGRVPPDVIFQDRFSISDWAQRGAFESLDGFIQRDHLTDKSCPVPEKYYPAAWQEAMYGGKLYAIPLAADVRYLYYNKEVFAKGESLLRKAHLDPTRPPKTWSEILAYGRALTTFTADGRLKSAGFIPGVGDSWLYLYAFQNNASFLSSDGKTCTLASKPVQEALDFLKEAYAILGGYQEATRFQSTFRTGENDPFSVGQVAMKIDGDWSLSGLVRYNPRLNFGVAPAPVPDDRFNKTGRFKTEKDQFITWSGGHSWAIPRGARNLEGAWRFIKWMTCTEGRMVGMRALAEEYRRLGRIFIPPLQAEIATTEIAYRELMSSDSRYGAAMRLHLELMPVARCRPATFVGQTLWDAHVRAAEQACLGVETTETALVRGQETVQRSLDEINNSYKYQRVDLRVPAWLGLAAALVGIVIMVSAIKRQKLGPLARHENRWGYLLIAPWLIGFFVFTLGPMVASLFFSFTQYDVLNDARWVGVKNYSDAMTYDRANVVKALMNVLYLGGIGVPLGLFTGLAVALLLNSAVRGMRIYRTLFYLPSIVPGVASTVLWMWILAPDPTRGLFNALWSHTISVWFGTIPPGWFSVEAWAKPTLIVMGLWGAVTDGAGPWRQFTNVTLPMLSPMIFFNTVMGFIGAIQTFDSVYILYGGSGTGQNDALLLPVIHLFRNGFGYFRMGYASALAWLIFIIILILTFIQFRLAPRWVHYEADR